MTQFYIPVGSCGNPLEVIDLGWVKVSFYQERYDDHDLKINIERKSKESTDLILESAVIIDDEPGVVYELRSLCCISKQLRNVKLFSDCLIEGKAPGDGIAIFVDSVGAHNPSDYKVFATVEFPKKERTDL